MEPTRRIQTLNPARWGAVQARLDAMVARDPAMAAVRREIVRPALALEALGADSLPALMNRPASIERLRAALALLRADLVARGEHGPEAHDPDVAESSVDAPPLAAWVVSEGAMLTLYGAAARVAPDVNVAGAFLDVVRRLLIECGVVESLARLDAFTPDDDTLAVLLQSVAELLRRNDPRVGPVLRADPVERRREARALSLHDLVARMSFPEAWSGAVAALDVTPRYAARGASVRVTVPAGIDYTAATVVFASPYVVALQAPDAEPARAATPRVMTAQVPEPAESGWVGVAYEGLVLRSNEARAAFARRYAATALDDVDAETLQRLLAIDLRDPTSSWPLPPRTESDLLTIAPRAARVTAVVARADGGDEQLFASEPARVDVTVEGLSSPPVPLRVRLLVDGRVVDERDAAPELAFTLRGDAVHVGVTLRAELAVRDEAPAFQGLDASPHVQLRPTPPVDGPDVALVIVLPRVIAGPARLTAAAGEARMAVAAPETVRVSWEQVTAVLDEIDARDVVTLQRDYFRWPTSEASLELLDAPLVSETDPRCQDLLESLAWIAAQSPHHEDALWLAVVPELDRGAHAARTEARRGFHLARDASCARGVAITTLSALPTLLREVVSRGDTEPRDVASPRLRLTGELDGDVVRLVTPRVEWRRGGRGDAFDVGVTLTLLDDAGRALARRALPVLRPTAEGSPSRFAALLPVTERAAAVEFRRDGRLLLRVERPRLPLGAELAAPTLRLDEDRGHARWSPAPSHPLGLTVWGFVEGVTRSSDQTPQRFVLPLARGGACCACADLGHVALGDFESLRLVATDGWNTMESDDLPLASGEVPAVRIVDLGDNRYWIDGAAGQVVSLDGRPLGTLDDAAGHMIQLRSDAAGELQVHAPSPSTPTVARRPAFVTLMPSPRPVARAPMARPAAVTALRRIGARDG